MLSVHQLITQSLSVTGANAESLRGAFGEVCNHLYIDALIILVFLLGALLLRSDKTRRPAIGRQVTEVRKYHDQGQHEKAVAAWHRMDKCSECAPESVLAAVLKSMLEIGENPASLGEYVASFADPRSKAMPPKASSPSEGLTSILNTMLKTAQPKRKVLEVYNALSAMRATPDEETYEILLCAHAGRANQAAVQSFLEEMTTNFHVVSPKAFAAVGFGYLQAKRTDLALAAVQTMSNGGCAVPPMLMSELTQAVAPQKDCIEKMLAIHGPRSRLRGDACGHLLLAAFRTKNFAAGERIWSLVQEEQIALPYPAYDAAVKFYTVQGSLHALQIFDEMCSKFTVTESCCVTYMSLAAEPKFLKLAEKVFHYRRTNGGPSISLYASLMKVYGAMRMYEAAVGIVERAEADGLEADEKMRACGLNFAAKMGNRGAVEAMSAGLPDADHLKARIGVCRAHKDVGRAVDSLMEATKAGAVDPRSYVAVVEMCVSGGEQRRAVELLEQMRADCPASPETYDCLLKAHCVAGQLSGAELVLAEMRKAGMPLHDPLNSMLLGNLRAKEYTLAWGTVQKIVEAGFADSQMLCVLMRTIKTCDDRVFRGKVLKLLEETTVDFASDSSAINTILDALVRLKCTAQLQRVMDRIRKAQTKPAVGALNMMIKALNSLGKVDEVKALWRESVEVREVQPTEVTVGCYVDALCCHGKLGEAVAVVSQWKDLVKGNCIVYSTLLKGCALAKDVAKALEVYQMMRDDGGVANTVTFNSLLDACARAGKVDEIKRIFREMAELGVEPDRITFSTMIKGYAHVGLAEEALDVLEKMRANQITPDLVTYNTILDGCAGHDQFARFDRVYERMLADGLTPADYTLVVRVKRYGREGNLAKAQECAKKMPQEFGFVASARALTCLLSACVSNKDLDKAAALVDRMLKDGPQPDALTYERVVTAFLRSEPDRALRYLKAALQRKTPLTPRFLENVVETLQGKGLGGSHAVPLVQELRAAGYPVQRLLVATTGLLSKAEVTKNAPWRRH